ncbi:hypothetical protein EJ06DRAFT_219978 [Trichodelitschia bisporula]|uniref:Uncharacterized protein n=1 Tax=Trichodelitschia bisporula TaxID=703511 RepID=A0A6G1I955_9PEZI|nr:hypothetical protein EJ06DRAFT_219978 [Trichodelitschia bisporula]
MELDVIVLRKVSKFSMRDFLEDAELLAGSVAIAIIAAIVIYWKLAPNFGNEIQYRNI